MAPTLITEYAVYNNAQTTGTLTTPSFTPANGEILIVKMATWSTSSPMDAPTGGAQTYHSAIISAPGGFNAWAGIYWAQVSGSPGAMTVSATTAFASWHSMVVQRWSGATMDATPAVNAIISGTGAPNVTVTTTAANSVISTVSGDAQSIDPSTRAYLSGATEDGLQDGHVGANGVTYFYSQTCGAAGAQTVGMSAPTGQKWVIAAVEIKAGTQVFTTTATATVTTTASLTRRVATALPATVTTTATLARRAAVAGAATVTTAATLGRRAAVTAAATVATTAAAARQLRVRLAATTTTSTTATTVALGKLVNLTLAYGAARLKWAFSLTTQRFQTGEPRRKWGEGEVDL